MSLAPLPLVLWPCVLLLAQCNIASRHVGSNKLLRWPQLLVWLQNVGSQFLPRMKASLTSRGLVYASEWPSVWLHHLNLIRVWMKLRADAVPVVESISRVLGHCKKCLLFVGNCLVFIGDCLEFVGKCLAFVGKGRWVLVEGCAKANAVAFLVAATESCCRVRWPFPSDSSRQRPFANSN